MGLARTMVLAIAATVAVAGTAAADQPYRSDQYGFSLTVPTGWTAVPETAAEPIRLRVRADANARVFCNVSTIDHASLKDVRQADMDTQLTQAAGEALIRRDFGAVTGATLQTLTVSIVQKGGHPAVSADLMVVSNGEAFRMRRLDLFRPGRQYMVNCGGPAADVQAFAAQVEAVHASFRVN